MTNRRDFIKFLGTATIGTILIPPFLESCGNNNNQITTSVLSKEDIERLSKVLLDGMMPNDTDNLVLADGLQSQVLISWDDSISANDKFGYNNDFLCFVPIEDGKTDDGLLWVNHEYTKPMFVSDYNFGENEVRTKEQVDKEMKTVGGSIIRVKKIEGKWTFIPNDIYNRRIDATTPLPFNWEEQIKDSDKAIGTHSNCSGGITPWGTILTCEENYDSFYGENIYDENNLPTFRPSGYGWEEFYPYPTEHYGWVVEVDPFTGKGQKHVALGRFAHECCTLKLLDDGRVVAYSGDDRAGEFIYKFISSEKHSLKNGTLYVADTINGKWVPIDYETNPVLQKKFKNQTEVLIRVREAARLLGATPQNRPEDVEIDPLTGSILVALTNNKAAEDFHGSILKITETDGKYDALTFTTETLIAGGETTGFSCPDNMVFDLAGNLWFTSDISGSVMNKPESHYSSFKNNGLFVLIRHGKDEGKIIQIASAPTDAELTGPWFSPDYKTLFLSIQHPGEQSRSLTALTSTWPHDADNIPKSSVVTIEGDLLDKLNYLNVV